MGTITEEISRIKSAKADIKTAIENKGIVIPASSRISDYGDLIRDIPKAGWPIAGAELVGSADFEYNLKEDTTWDSWTPSSTSTNIKAVGPTSCSYTLTAEEMMQNCIIMMQADETHFVYTERPSYRYWTYHRIYPKMTIYYPVLIPDLGEGHYEMRGVASNYALDLYYDNSTLKTTTTVTYGIGTSAASSLNNATIANGRIVKFTEPIITARCSTSSSHQFNVNVANLIDSANTYMTTHQRIYKVKKEIIPFSAYYDALPTTLFT